jgi:DNA-binding NarL/FixJ family response regulator
MGRSRLLLVENDRHLVDGLRRYFEASGRFEIVHCTATADSAIRWLGQHPQGWDLALIDIFLDAGNGYAVLKHCRKFDPRQRVVMMSNYARREAVEQALAQGADRFFDKATELDQLLAYCLGQP